MTQYTFTFSDCKTHETAKVTSTSTVIYFDRYKPNYCILVFTSISLLFYMHLCFRAVPLMQRSFTPALEEITSELTNNNYQTFSFLVSYVGTSSLHFCPKLR